MSYKQKLIEIYNEAIEKIDYSNELSDITQKTLR